MEVEGLIRDDRERGTFFVHRSSMTSQEVFELEQRRVFDRCWLYFGHESEVPNPGDFLRREVAGRPLMLIHGADGTIRAFYNTCTHRGSRICRQDTGNARSFQCFYHAWTFNSLGELIGVPDEAGFGPAYSRADYHLKSPSYDSYQGFIFVNFNSDAEPLVEYLGAVTEYLDLLADHSEIGMRIAPGTQRYGARANWKLLVENSSDGYHFLPTHETLTKFLAQQGDDLSGNLVKGTTSALDLGNGHMALEHPTHFGRPVAHWHPSMGEGVRAEIEQTRRRLIDRHGEERGRRIAESGRAFLIYPNFMILDENSPIIRVINPVAPDELEVTAWTLVTAEESPELTAVRLRNMALTVGAGGFATPDDIEAVESCQQGFRAREVEWSEISRGIGKTPTMMHEQQIRSFWREWHAHLCGHEHGDHTPDYLEADATPVATS